MNGFAPALAALLVLAACGGPAARPEPSLPVLPGGTARLTATDSLSVLPRPDAASPVWGLLLPGDSVSITCVTREGWLGFDPGVAQAGNSGVFRCRWIAPGGPFRLAGDPADLDTVWGSSAGVVYAMTFDPVALRVEPDSGATVADSLPAGSAARIVSRREGWYLVDPSDGPTPVIRSGWVPEAEVSVSGDPETVVQLGDPVLPGSDPPRMR